MNYTEDQIRNLVRKDIEKKETLGTQSGGSGHLGHISYSLDAIKAPVSTEKGLLVTYEYTLITETEFTYYPDNPPYENKCSGALYLPE